MMIYKLIEDIVLKACKFLFKYKLFKQQFKVANSVRGGSMLRRKIKS